MNPKNENEEKPGEDAQYTFSTAEKKEEWKEEFGEMKDQLKALQGSNNWSSLVLKELCLAPNVTLPKKFKMPDFDKYNGIGNPIYHLKSYCSKMFVWSQDENFLLLFFHESLKGPRWNGTCS